MVMSLLEGFSMNGVVVFSPRNTLPHPKVDSQQGGPGGIEVFTDFRSIKRSDN